MYLPVLLRVYMCFGGQMKIEPNFIVEHLIALVCTR